MTDLCTKLLMEVHDEARKHKVKQVDAHRVFFDAYQEHKKKHGSFKGVPHYNARMNERYRFMHQKAIEYINGGKQ